MTSLAALIVAWPVRCCEPSAHARPETLRIYWATADSASCPRNQRTPQDRCNIVVHRPWVIPRRTLPYRSDTRSPGRPWRSTLQDDLPVHRHAILRARLLALTPIAPAAASAAGVPPCLANRGRPGPSARAGYGPRLAGDRQLVRCARTSRSPPACRSHRAVGFTA